MINLFTLINLSIFPNSNACIEEIIIIEIVIIKSILVNDVYSTYRVEVSEKKFQKFNI